MQVLARDGRGQGHGLRLLRNGDKLASTIERRYYTEQ
jgi:hypothetical protein